MMRLFASCVDRSDVNDLFPGRVRKTAPGKTEPTERYQEYPKRFVSWRLPWPRWPAVRATPAIDSFPSEETCTAKRPVRLRLEHLFNLADFLLNFACEFFVLAFGR